MKFKNFIDFGLILKVGENLSILKSLIWMKQKGDLKKDIWKEKIEN